MQTQQSVTIFKALADPTRLDIVRKLARAGDSTSCGEVSTCSSLSQPAMSHHLSKLVDAGVIFERKDGKQKFYALNIELLSASGISADLL